MHIKIVSTLVLFSWWLCECDYPSLYLIICYFDQRKQKIGRYFTLLHTVCVYMLLTLLCVLPEWLLAIMKMPISSCIFYWNNIEVDSLLLLLSYPSQVHWMTWYIMQLLLILILHERHNSRNRTKKQLNTWLCMNIVFLYPSLGRVAYHTLWEGKPSLLVYPFYSSCWWECQLFMNESMNEWVKYTEHYETRYIIRTGGTIQS